MDIKRVEQAIRDIPDFPKQGIVFKDITPLLKDGALFAEVIDEIASRYLDSVPDYIVGIESRGFIFGAALALKLGCGFVPVRKKGKLPYDTIETSYQLEYGEATIELHSDAVSKDDTVLLIDDLLATGGTISASIELLEKLEAKIIGIELIVELAFLNGREKFNYPVNTIIKVN